MLSKVDGTGKFYKSLENLLKKENGKHVSLGLSLALHCETHFLNTALVGRVLDNELV